MAAKNMEQVGRVMARDGDQAGVPVTIYIDNDRVARYAAKAIKNATGKCRIGPVLLVADRPQADTQKEQTA
jgi:hypothetical protein